MKYYKDEYGRIIKDSDKFGLSYYDKQTKTWKDSPTLGEIYTGETRVKSMSLHEVKKEIGK